MARVFVCLLLAGVMGCASSGKGVKYDAQHDQMLLTFPRGGSLVIPNRWKEVYYNKNIGAHSFRRADSTQLTVTVFSPEETTLHKKGSTDREYLAAYTEVQIRSFHEQLGMVVETLQDNSTADGYLLLWVHNPDDRKDQATVLLGTKRGLFYDFRYTPTERNQQDANAFLVKLFLDN